MKIIGIRCDDIARRKEKTRFGGWNSWEKLMESMERQWRLPFEERMRPCLKKHDDWWIYQASACVKCPDAIWHIEIDSQPRIARLSGLERGIVELKCKDTGEVLRYDARKGFLDEPE